MTILEHIAEASYWCIAIIGFIMMGQPRNQPEQVRDESHDQH